MTTPRSFTTQLAKILKWIEILAIVVSVFGLIFKVLHLAGANSMLMIGLFTLSTAYFLSAFVFIADEDDNAKKGFADVLPVMLRKIMFIGLSVCWIGFLFTILHLNGATEMLLISFISMGGGCLASMILILGNRRRMKHLQAPLIRVVITVLICFMFAVIPLI
jgi:hypothetical protein